MTARRKRTAILISGRGSNMASLIAEAQEEDYPAEIVLVLSNNADAGGLETARSHGIATAVVDHRPFGKDREAFENALQGELEKHAIDFVCLAGFMRILTASFVERWTGRMINIHPSLLPAFKGLHTHERALEEGVVYHGCTVHFVVPEMDAGPIIGQMKVKVREDDTPETLAARVLKKEHRLYPKALALAAGGKVRIEGRRTRRVRDDH